jgi:hypothetical protein
MKDHTEKYRSKMGWNEQGQKICYTQSQKLTYSTHTGTRRIFCIYNTSYIDYRLKHNHHKDIFPELFSSQYGFCTVENYSYFHSHMSSRYTAVHFSIQNKSTLNINIKENLAQAEKNTNENADTFLTVC